MKIEIEGVGGVKLFSEDGYEKWLRKKNVGYLLDSEGDQVDFEGLAEGGTYTLPPPPVPMVILELSLKTKTIVRSWKKEELTMDDLEMTARKMFDIPIARLAFFLRDNEPLDCDEELDSIPVNTTTKIKVVVSRVGFSQITTVKEALQLLGQAGDSIPIDNNIFPSPSDVPAENEELNHAVSTLRRLNEVVLLPHGCEATRRLYIDPMLLASARIAGDVLIEVEKEYENRDVHGPIDYVFKYKEQTICVTEGKKDQIDRGVVQNVAQLAVVADDRKRKISEISPAPVEEPTIYGIATTYLNWTFLVLKDGKVTQSSIYGIKDADKDDVAGIIGRIVAILNAGKC